MVKEEFKTGVPQGMRALVFNTRRPVFADIRETRGTDFVNNFWRVLAHDEAGPVEFVPCADETELLSAFWDAAKHYNQIVTLLNLRQKGPGSREARKEQMSAPDATDIQIGRFTMTVVGVDLPNNTVSVIDGRGGPVQTYRADTIAKQDMLKKIKVGDVVIGLTTPLMITAISPVK